MSDTVTLELECFPDELSPIQLETYEKAEKEHSEIRAKLNQVLRGSNSENIFSGNVFSAYQLSGLVTGLESYAKAPSAIRTQNRKIVKSLKNRVQTISDNDDDDVEYMPLSKRIATPPPARPVTQSRKLTTKQLESVKQTPVKPPKASSSSSKNAPAMALQKPCESNSFGGLLVGISTKAPVIKDTSGVDSQEVNFSKLQGKTYPSLVVFVRPTLVSRDGLPNDRPVLDGKVKTVLMYTPSKFTEWLIQQGLVRSEQDCAVHPNVALKLGMYSDVSRFPYSGGYVWISECCQQKFASVFNGSIFESSTQTPSVLIKLVYHWSCQTNIQNAVQWVKVTNLFIKQFFTHLRAVCTVALYNHFGLLGGPNKRIEVGVISLGTSSADGAQRQVKVEVLGIYCPTTKQIRLRAVEPLPYAEKVYRKRFLKILEPLVDWVHEDTIILTDLTVDKTTLNNYGFRNVIQSNPADVGNNPRSIANSNVTIMDYLRRVVPRMFQNTLSLLNRSMIQQFLDELVWREIFGTTPNTTFETMLRHISEQTRMNQKDRLVPRLTKVALNPFKNWRVSGTTQKPVAASYSAPKSPTVSSSSSSAASRKSAPPVTTAQKRKRSPPRPAPPPPPPKRVAPPPPVQVAKRPYVKKVVPEPVDNVSLEGYYYGIHVPRESEPKKDSCEEVVFEAKCPECELTFVTNLELQDHLFDHVPDVTPHKYQCRYCFDRYREHDHLMKHIIVSHPIEVSRKGLFYDLICEQQFTSSQKLALHMSRSHYPSELPYHCGCCTFASSSRRMTVDHFYEEHGKSATLMCPMCLQMFMCGNRQDGALNQNVNAFLEHLKGHRGKAAKPCGRCVLSFLTIGQLRVHMLMDHHGGCGEEGQLQPISKSNTMVPRPKSKVLPAGLETFLRLVEPVDKLLLDVPNGRMCLECGQDFDTAHHIVGKVQCPICNLATYCLPFALEHAQKCSANTTVAKIPLGRDYFCVCDFTTNDGSLLARHMMSCERKSAYTSMEEATANTKKPSVLDGLGLVRREDGEEGGEAVQETSLEETQMEVGEGEVTLAVAEPVEMDATDSFIAEEEFNPNMSLVDLAPTPSVIVQHMPDGVRDDYQDLQTPQVPDSHLMGYGHTDDSIVTQVVHGNNGEIYSGESLQVTEDDVNFPGY